MARGYPESTEKASALLELARWESDQKKKLAYWQEAVDVINGNISAVFKNLRDREEE